MGESMTQADKQIIAETTYLTNEQIIKRLAEIESTLQLLKKLYAERDQLTLQLKERIDIGREVTEGDYIFSIVDNFANNNVIFRPTAMRRFELKVDSQFARKQLQKGKKGE